MQVLDIATGYFNSGYYRLLQATKGYYRVLQVTIGYYRLLQVISGYYMLLRVTTSRLIKQTNDYKLNSLMQVIV